MLPPMLGPDAMALLPALVALLETESVTEAAARLGVGQPAMSRTLARLRALTADPLLVPAGRRLVRTRRADEILPRATEALAAAAGALERPAAFDPRTAKGTIALALADDLQAMLLEPLLVRLRGDAPGLDLRIRPLSLSTVDDVRRGLVELAITPDLGRAGGMPDLSDFVSKTLYVRRFVAVARRRRRLGLDAFCAAEHVLVSWSGDDTGYVDASLRAIGRSRRIAVTVPTFQAALALVARTELVTTLPEEIVRGLAPRLFRAACPVPTPELPMVMLWNPRATTDARHRWLRRAAEETVKTLQALRRG